MKLLSISVKNFRNIKDVFIEFSVDETRPITIIRAENGVGKTTLLLALRWVLFGGLADPSRNSKKKPMMKAPASWDIKKYGSDVPVEVELWLTAHGGNDDTEYRVVRKQTVRVSEEDPYGQDLEEVIEVLEKTPQGFVTLQHPDEFLTTHVLTPDLMPFFLVDAEGRFPTGSGGRALSNVEYIEMAVKVLSQRRARNEDEVLKGLSERANQVLLDLMQGGVELGSDADKSLITSLIFTKTFGIEARSTSGSTISIDSFTQGAIATVFASIIFAVAAETGGTLPLVIDADYGFMASALKGNFISSVLNASKQPVLLVNSFDFESAYGSLLGKMGKHFELYFDDSNSTFSREIGDN